MKNAGWEIKPLGWVALIMLAGIVIYFTFFTINQKKNRTNKGKRHYWKADTVNDVDRVL